MVDLLPRPQLGNTSLVTYFFPGDSRNEIWNEIAVPLGTPRGKNLQLLYIHKFKDGRYQQRLTVPLPLDLINREIANSIN